MPGDLYIVESKVCKREGQKEDNNGDVLAEVKCKSVGDEEGLQNDEHDEYYLHWQPLNLIIFQHTLLYLYYLKTIANKNI